MEIINSKTDGFKQARAGRKPSVYFGGKRLHISAAAVLECELKAGQFVHFVVDTDRLYFFANDDKSGIKLFGHNVADLHGYVHTVRKLLEKKMPYVSFHRGYPVRVLPTKLNGEILIEILIHKKI